MCLLIKLFCAIFVLVTLSSCAAPPKDTSNVCNIFEERRSWYKHAKKAAKRWSTDISMMMAIIHQESRFVQHAKPPRRTILWVLPGPRLSSAYGYAQARDSTWEWYQKDTGRWRSNRNDFSDAVDFVGWYITQSRRLSNILPNDAYSHYLAYHEGQTGFNRKTFKNKKWLLKVAQKVQRQTQRFQSQLKSCEDDLNKSWWWPF